MEKETAAPFNPDEICAHLADDLRQEYVAPAQWRCGIEYELFGYTKDGLNRLDPSRIAHIVERFAATPSSLIKEDSLTTGARLHERVASQDGAHANMTEGELSIEPGGQLEFSSLPRRTLIELERDLKAYLARLKDIAQQEQVIFVHTGFDALRPLDEQHWFPKRRYQVMRPFLTKRGERAADMMTRTCAIQASYDFSSEADLARKLELSTRIAPIATAMFANSPFADGKLTGFKSTRAATWLATDTARTGGIPPVFDDDFDFTAFVEYAVNVPLMFVRRGEHYTLKDGDMTFGDFINRQTDYDRASLLFDWREHLSTLFTDVRLRSCLEMRMADCVEPSLGLAFAALWKGLLYDVEAATAARELMPRLSRDETLELHGAVARDALAARLNTLHVLPLAKEIVRVAESGLRRIAPDEVRFLDGLHSLVIEDEMCPADKLIAAWGGEWNGRIEKLIEHCRVA
ncbi:MAG: glutamate-cysteine ligase family protein [Pyrinomonadaceae bacterium MAG19_C2-C3]|nr:glutamate-cysteine ligase family protein [Pyrinomonadaceae bacterium MAG19_C2-C3]